MDKTVDFLYPALRYFSVKRENIALQAVNCDSFLLVILTTVRRLLMAYAWLICHFYAIYQLRVSLWQSFKQCVRLGKVSPCHMTASRGFQHYHRHAPVSMQFRHQYIPYSTCVFGSSILCTLGQRTLWKHRKTTIPSRDLVRYSIFDLICTQGLRPCDPDDFAHRTCASHVKIAPFRRRLKGRKPIAFMSKVLKNLEIVWDFVSKWHWQLKMFCHS